ncbi:MAG: hypothetical protein SVM80_04495 [Halobacteriota archaeon]|nr:hypothetical protein [Halobacteriota archaeon]
MDIEHILEMIEPKTETEKIVYLVDLLKNSTGDEHRVVWKILDEIVQSKYERLMQRGLILGIGTLQRLTKIRPILDQRDLQKSYKKLIDDRSLGFAEKVRILYNVTGIKPELDDEFVHSVYRWLIERERVNDIEILWSITGLQPSEDLIVALKDLQKERERKLQELKLKEDS